MSIRDKVQERDRVISNNMTRFMNANQLTSLYKRINRENIFSELQRAHDEFGWIRTNMIRGFWMNGSV